MDLQPDLADEQIVKLVISGNKEKFGDIMERYEPKLMRYVVYLVHDEPMATDIVQETFIKSYKNLKSYNPKYKFSSWIYRIAHNEAMNAVKRDKNIVNGLEIDELKEATYETSVILDIDRAILRGNINKCLNGIDIKYREVIMLQYYENMKYSEIADVLHVPASTVGVWAARGKTMLKKICNKKGLK